MWQYKLLNIQFMTKITFTLSFTLALYLIDYQYRFESRSGNKRLSR